MNFNEYYHTTAYRYPEYVSQKEMATILGVCVSKAYQLEKDNIIPFEYENTPDGRKQRIKVSDVLRYQFIRTCFDDESESEFIETLRHFYQEQLKGYSQLLRVTDIIRFTGYVKTTINNWIARGKLKALSYNGQRIHSTRSNKKGTLVTKDEFIAFLSSTYYRNISRKSITHARQEIHYLHLFSQHLNQRGVFHE